MQIYLKSFVSSPKSANSFSLLPDRDIRSIYQTDKTNFKKEEKMYYSETHYKCFCSSLFSLSRIYNYPT